MKNNKKGMSQVIEVVVIVVLVLIAMAIIWGVYGNVIKGKTGETAMLDRCMGIDISPTTGLCVIPSGGTVADQCTTTITRGTGGDEITGIKIIYTGASGNNTIKDIPGNIEPLHATPIKDIQTGLGEDVVRIGVTAYLTSETGDEYLCPGIKSYTIN